MKRTSHRIGPPHKRRGAFLIIAMICLVLTSGLLATLLKMAALSRKAAQMEFHSLQAEWLAESALDRAAAKLSGDANYQGETWDIKAEDLGGHHAGQVVIAVKAGDQTHLREVEAVARFPLEGPRSVKRSKRLVVAASPQDAETGSQASSPASAEKPEAEGKNGR